MKRAGWAVILVPLWLAAGADRAGPYLEAGLGTATYEDDGRLASVDGAGEAQYRFIAGAFINSYLSVELGFSHFNDFEGKTAEGERTREAFDCLSVGAVAHYPLFDDRIDLFAKFGAGQIFWNETGNGNRDSSAAALLYGAGVGVRATSRLTFNVGYDFHSFGMDDNTTRYDMNIGSVYFDVQVRF